MPFGCCSKQRCDSAGRPSKRWQNTLPGSVYSSLKLSRKNRHALCFVWQVPFEGMKICDKIGDLICVFWITDQVITDIRSKTGAHFLNIASGDALYKLSSLSIHTELLFLAQVCDAIRSEERRVGKECRSWRSPSD